MIEKLYTVEEVAELASVTGRTIRNYLKSGRLVGRKIGGQWRFPEAEVQRLLTGGAPELMDEDEAYGGMDEPIPAPAPQPVAAVAQEASMAQLVAEEAAPPMAAPPQPAYTEAAAATRPAPLPKATVPPQHRGGQGVTNAPQAEAYEAQPVQQAPVQQQAQQPVQQVQPQARPVQAPVQAPAPQQPAPVYEAPQPVYSQPVYTTQVQQAPTAPVQAQPVLQQPIAQQSVAPLGQPGVPAYVQVPVQQAYPAQSLPTDLPPGYVAAYPAAPLYEPAPGGYLPSSAVPPAYAPGPEASPSFAAPEAEPGKAKAPAAPPYQAPAAEATPEPAPQLSDVGNRVTRFISEVHDYSSGPQMCAVVDLHQSFSAARITSQRLSEIADEESEGGLLCQSFVEFDERFYVARYTLFGTTSFLLRCLKLIG